MGGISIFGLNSILRTNKLVDHTHLVLEAEADIIGSAIDMEAGMRGYLLAGKEDFLTPYKNGENDAYTKLGELKETVSDNAGQLARLNKAEKTLREWQTNVVEPIIALRRDIGDANTMNDIAHIVAEAKGKIFFDKFREQIALFSEREAALLIKRRQAFSEAKSIVDDLLKKNGLSSQVLKQLEIMDKNEKWVNHTHEVIASANAILASAVDMETGMRGYLLAGKEEFLDPYTDGRKNFDALISEMTKTVSDSPEQVKLLTEISKTIHSWADEIVEPIITLRRQIGDAKTMDDMADLIREGRGKAYFDAFRDSMGAFHTEERTLMESRKADNDSMVDFIYMLIIASVIISLILGIIVSIMVGNTIANPIITMTSAMRNLADGNTSFEIPGIGRKDEVGKMADTILIFKENKITADRLAEEQKIEEKEKEKERLRLKELIAKFETTMAGVLDNLNSADQIMSKAAGDVKNTSESTKVESQTVASSAVQASSNVQTVATAAEELSASITEISRQVAQSNSVSNNAVSEANKTSEQIKVLEENVSQISAVVSLINDIAEQTNLLALNATIEAARAGDAGKGFAVVASEVKNLASQTAKATEEISTQIAEVQSSTDGAVGAINSISGIIGTINEVSASISAAVEEQGAATSEIARNVEEAARGTESVSSSIQDVLHAAEESSTAAQTITEASNGLSQQTSKLRNEVSVFLNEVQNGGDDSSNTEPNDENLNFQSENNELIA